MVASRLMLVWPLLIAVVSAQSCSVNLDEDASALLQASQGLRRTKPVRVSRHDSKGHTKVVAALGEATTFSPTEAPTSVVDGLAEKLMGAGSELENVTTKVMAVGDAIGEAGRQFNIAFQSMADAVVNISDGHVVSRLEAAAAAAKESVKDLKAFRFAAAFVNAEKALKTLEAVIAALTQDLSDVKEIQADLKKAVEAVTVAIAQIKQILGLQHESYKVSSRAVLEKKLQSGGDLARTLRKIGNITAGATSTSEAVGDAIGVFGTSVNAAFQTMATDLVSISDEDAVAFKSNATAALAAVKDVAEALKTKDLPAAAADILKALGALDGALRGVSALLGDVASLDDEIKALVEAVHHLAEELKAAFPQAEAGAAGMHTASDPWVHIVPVGPRDRDPWVHIVPVGPR